MAPEHLAVPQLERPRLVQRLPYEPCDRYCRPYTYVPVTQTKKPSTRSRPLVFTDENEHADHKYDV